LDEWVLSRGRVPSIIICTGFIAKDKTGRATTLRRNGSDYSATIMGGLLEAGNITIWTDVDGVYSADPRKVPEAVCLKSLSYHEVRRVLPTSRIDMFNSKKDLWYAQKLHRHCHAHT
jgi:aspartokinase/homoserine dehydrogenase 1